MSQNIRDFIPSSCELLALGEPTHAEPAFPRVRNIVLAQLIQQGFRSIALETDRVAALTVNDFIQHGIGSLDSAMSEGFSHGFGNLDANRDLVAWMREYNETHPHDPLTFHGFDAPTEMSSAPSPRRYLEYARDYLGIDVDLTGLLGADEQWDRTEAVLNPAESVGDTAEAEKLRVIADDMLTKLYAGAPNLIAETSQAEWLRAETHLTTGLGLLRYHKQSAQRLEQSVVLSGQLATRDALMAQNLLAIRGIEQRRGPTLVFAQNQHLRRNQSHWQLADMDLAWFSAGAIIGSLIGDYYTFIAGSLGRSDALDLHTPEPDTYEAALHDNTHSWHLTPTTSLTIAHTRTDITPEQGYFPLDQATLDTASAILHVNDGSPASEAARRNLVRTTVRSPSAAQTLLG